MLGLLTPTDQAGRNEGVLLWHDGSGRERKSLGSDGLRVSGRLSFMLTHVEGCERATVSSEAVGGGLIAEILGWADFCPQPDS